MASKHHSNKKNIKNFATMLKMKGHEEGQEDIVIYNGIYRVQIPIIRKESRRPAGVSEVLNLMLEGKLNDKEVYYTASGIAYVGKNIEGFKVVPFSQDLATLSESVNEILLSEEQYRSIPTEEFTRFSRHVHIDWRMSEKEAIDNPILLELFKEDGDALERCVRENFRKVHDAYEEKLAMGIFIKGPQKGARLDVIYLYGLEGRYDILDGNLFDPCSIVGLPLR